MHQPKQLQLFDFPTLPQIKAVHDPYWDKLEAQADDIVEQAFLNINAENEVFDVGAEIAPEQIALVRAQIFLEQSPYKSVRAQVNNHTAPEHNYPESSVKLNTSQPYTHWVEKYWVKRRGEKHEYYRYCWMEGRKKYRCHIGGKARSISANHKKKIVEEAIFDGQSPQEIKQLIRQFMN